MLISCEGVFEVQLTQSIFKSQCTLEHLDCELICILVCPALNDTAGGSILCSLLSLNI